MSDMEISLCPSEASIEEVVTMVMTAVVVMMFVAMRVVVMVAMVIMMVITVMAVMMTIAIIFERLLEPRRKCSVHSFHPPRSPVSQMRVCKIAPTLQMKKTEAWRS